MSLQYPERLDNGELVMLDSDLLDKLRDGDAISGWRGDPNIFLWYNKLDDRIYLSSYDALGEEYVIMRSPQGERVVDMNLLHWLAAHDPMKGYDVAATLDTQEAEKEALENKFYDDAHAEVAQKLVHAIQKDLK